MYGKYSLWLRTSCLNKIFRVSLPGSVIVMKQNENRYKNRRPDSKASAKAKPAFKVFSPQQARTLIIIFIISFVAALVLELYTFGFPDGFFGRWFSAIMVFFLFFSITTLGIIPLVNYVVNRWLRF